MEIAIDYCIIWDMDNLEILKNNKVTPRDYNLMQIGKSFGGIYFPAGSERVMVNIGLNETPFMYLGREGLPRIRAEAIRGLRKKYDIEPEWNEILERAKSLDHEISVNQGTSGTTIINTWNACGFVVCHHALINRGFKGLIADSSFLIEN